MLGVKLSMLSAISTMEPTSRKSDIPIPIHVAQLHLLSDPDIGSSALYPHQNRKLTAFVPIARHLHQRGAI
jgi:hypothetical protein